LFNVKRQVHLQAKSTAQSANREKSPKLAFEPRRDRFSGGPGVPNSGQMRVFHAANQRIPETEDWLAEGSEFELSGDFVNRQLRHAKASSSLKKCDRVDSCSVLGLLLKTDDVAGS
jgi:hypothetical protein